MKFIKISMSRFRLIDFAFLVLLTSLAINIASLYVLNERFFYYWDYGGFEGVATNLAEQFFQSPAAALKSVILSVNYDYNFYYAVPLIPFIGIMGSSRLSYILSIVFVYQIPFMLVVGAIATKFIPNNRRYVFWSTAFIALLTPIAWAATLRGYPDISAALLMALAILIFLRDIELEQLWVAITIGILVGIAIMLRRAFLYDMIALFISIAIVSLYSLIIQLRREGLGSWHGAISRILRISLMSASVLGTILLIGMPFFLRLINTKFSTLYASYAMEPSVIMNFFVSTFGWITWIMTISGFAIGLFKRSLKFEGGLLIFIFSAVSLLIWIFLVRYIGLTFPQHFVYFFILGISVLLWTVNTLPTRVIRRSLVSIIALFIGVNMVFGLVPLNYPNSARPFFSQTHPPLRRPDYGEVVRLIKYLRDTAAPEDPIYIVDSSSLMNYDLAIKAEQALYPDQKLNILVTSQIDSRDFYPLEQLLQAEYLVVSTPFQYHLSRQDQQKVVEYVFRAFTEKYEIAADFIRMPVEFHMAHGAVLRIFKREQPTSMEAAVRALHDMVSFIGQRPSGQPDWIVLKSVLPLSINTEQGNSYHLNSELSETIEGEALTLLFLEPISDQRIISGNLRFHDSLCRGFALKLLFTDSTGTIVNSEDSMKILNKGKTKFDFEISNFVSKNLMLQLTRTKIIVVDSNCPFTLNWNFSN